MDAIADRNLLFGLIALQNGMIDQSALILAFGAWTRDKARPLAEILLEQGAIDEDGRAMLSGLAAWHLKRHGDDAGKSLGAVPAARSLRRGLAELTDPDVDATLGLVAASSTTATNDDPEATGTYGAPLGDGKRFRILRPHAKGGLGEVFVALDDELHREVALKQILDHHADDPLSRTRFVLEAEITGGLEHPGIVPVYGLGSHGDGRPYYAMRFIRGDSLKEAIAAFHGDERLRREAGKRSLALRKLLRRFVDVCNAIDYAHGRGILHRDLKPANVIVGKHGETLVIDWGLAKAMGHAEPASTGDERTLMPSSSSGSAETLPGSAIGTPAYMSPEQASGDLERLGPRSDVYSLGATLHCLLTGKAPFEGSDLGAVLRAVQRGNFPRPRQVDPTIDRALEAVCLKAMATDPGDRHATARALAEDVERWAADEPVSAWREPFARRARRWARRNRSTVTAAAASVLVALAATAAVLALQTQANRDLRAANAREATANRDLRAANAREATANHNLSEAVGREQARFDLALDAIKAYHEGVSRDVLLKRGEFKDLRTNLLAGARDFYGRLEELLGGLTDRRSRLALASALKQVADLTGNIGSQEEALLVLEKALAIYRELASEPDPSMALLIDLAQCYGSAAILQYGIGRRPEALATMARERDVYRELIKASSTDVLIRRNLGNTLNNLGVVLHNSGRFDEAIAAYLEARAIREALAKDYPDDLGIRNRLARTLNSLGVYYQDIGAYDEALEMNLNLCGIREKLVLAKPEDLDYRYDLTTSRENTAVVLLDLGRPEESRASAELSVASSRELIRSSPNLTKYKESLARTLNILAQPLIQLGRLDEARSALDESKSVLRSLIDADPTVTVYREKLARNEHAAAMIEEKAGELDRSIASAGRSRDLLDPILKANPGRIEDQLLQAQVLRTLGGLQLRSGDRGGAKAALGQSFGILEPLARDHPENLKHGTTLAGLILQLEPLDPSRARVDRAIAALREVLERLEKIPASASLSHRRACIHSLLAGLAGPNPGEEAEVAMTLLRQAIAAGFRDHRGLADDRDLDPLRSRPDFRLMMNDLAFPADPFAR